MKQTWPDGSCDSRLPKHHPCWQGEGDDLILRLIFFEPRQRFELLRSVCKKKADGDKDVDHDNRRAVKGRPIVTFEARNSQYLLLESDLV